MLFLFSYFLSTVSFITMYTFYVESFYFFTNYTILWYIRQMFIRVAVRYDKGRLVDKYKGLDVEHSDVTFNVTALLFI